MLGDPRFRLAAGRSSFTRTKKTIEATWGAASVDLTYRAGVTCLGDVKLADGGAGKVRCSDLAMHDP